MTAQDFDYLKEEKGPMDADRRSIAVMSGIWNISYFTGTNIAAKELLNGWTISPIVYLQSGGPFEITTGSTKNFDSNGHNRPDAVPGVNPFLNPHRCRVCSTGSVTAEWFNTAAFMPNGPGVLGGIGPGGADGNVGRDTLLGPGYRNIDLGIFKNIYFPRGIVFQLRGEATNIFNMVSLANPTASLSSGNNGKITSAAGSPRVIQVGARLSF